MSCRLILCFLAFASWTSAADWSVEPVGNGNKPSLAVGEDGTVHVAWAIESFGESVYYASREGDAWTTEVVQSGYYNDALDLVLDGEGKAHIAFHDHDAEDAAHLHATAMSWVSSYVSSPGHDGWNPSLAVDPEGGVHMASFDPEAGIEYAVVRPSGTVVEMIGTGFVVRAYGVSLALGSDSTPHVCFHDPTSSQPGSASLRIAARGPGGWSTEVVDTGADLGQFASLAFDSHGTPHVAYLKRESATTATVRYATRDGSSWVTEDVLLLEDLNVDLDGAHRTATLAIDNEDRPHIAASDRAFVFYAVAAEDGWTVDTVIEQSSTEHRFGQLASLGLGPNDEPHIAFYEIHVTGGSPIGTIYHAKIETSREARHRRPSRRVTPVSIPLGGSLLGP